MKLVNSLYDYFSCFVYKSVVGIIDNILFLEKIASMSKFRNIDYTVSLRPNFSPSTIEIKKILAELFAKQEMMQKL